MSYVGNAPAVAYTNTVKDTFSGDNSTVAFTLSVPSTTNNVRVVVENVIQDPTVAYSVSGTTLTFTSAPPSGTDNIYVVHLGPAVQTVVPPDSVTITDLNAYANGAVAFTANRASSDGTIIDLQKDGTTVGSIGVTDGDNLFISSTASAHGGLKFNNTAMAAYVDGTNSDGTMDVGTSAVRFKDLYLSGGVYLGGTGAANKLDDYETGTWTPVVYGATTAGTFSGGAVEGRYTKVGDMVTLYCYIAGATLSGAAGAVYISGLPFTALANPLAATNTIGRWSNVNLSTNAVNLGVVNLGSNATLSIRESFNDGTTASFIYYTALSSGSCDFVFQISYRAT